MKSYTLHQLNEYIRRVLALNLSDAIWVSCEIAQIQESKGHYYLSLIQKGEESEEILARSEAILWNNQFRRLRRKVGKEIKEILQQGMQVLLKVKVDFHERYGLRYQIEDVDPAYTMGQLALQKRQTLLQLEKEGLLENNRTLPLAPVLQRIAILSSVKAAGYQDFIRQLEANMYGYQFDCQLFASSVQGGAAAEQGLVEQLKRINEMADLYDCVVIVRGGGASIDLMLFDQLLLCRTIAEMKLPVLTGIGHDIDQTVADTVAWEALKTPTAVADFLINQNTQFEAQVLDLGRRLESRIQNQLADGQMALNRIEDHLKLNMRNLLNTENRMMDYLAESVPERFQKVRKDAESTLDLLEARQQILSPESTLKRGYSLTYQNGKIIRSVKEVKKGELITLLQDGEVKTKVQVSSKYYSKNKNLL